jgi:hypothetical protein
MPLWAAALVAVVSLLVAAWFLSRFKKGRHHELPLGDDW